MPMRQDSKGKLRSLFQITGQAVGAAFDPVIKTVEHATPEIIKKPIASFFAKNVAPRIQKSGEAVASLPGVQKFADSSQGEALDRDVQAFNEFLNLVPLPAAGRAAGKAGTLAVEKTATAAKTAAEVFDRTVSEVTPPRRRQGVQRRRDQTARLCDHQVSVRPGR